MTTRRATGCLIGMALGDALAAPVEFSDIQSIRQHFPPDGPQSPMGDPARVTDDTQMALAVGEALFQCDVPPSPDQFEAALRAEFIKWANSPDNTRAPGKTCMRACRRLARGIAWQQATVAGSKGCGANMRVAPVPLYCRAHGVDAAMCAALAQFQAALTHGHPTGLAAADLTSRCITVLAHGEMIAGLVDNLRDYARAQRRAYHHTWLGTLWQQPGTTSPQDFIARGWDECLDVLDRLAAALDDPDRETDPCLQTGAGWIAEEAFATGLLCFLLFPDDPVAALRRAALTSGDSDSIACLTGAFAGAHHGMGRWPQDWTERIEYRQRLTGFGAAWDTTPHDN